MKSLRNSVTLIGRLGKDPEVREFNNGKLAKFTLATNETYQNDKGEKVVNTYWHNCVIWGKQADTARNLLSKGKELAVHGKLVYNSFKDKEGNTRTSPEIHVHEFILMGKAS